MREDKVKDVVRGARSVFFEHGFAGARVDQIADAACVSKATMYAHFPTKTDLFVEVVARECDMLAEELEKLLLAQGPMEETLRSALLQNSDCGRFTARIHAVRWVA